MWRIPVIIASIFIFYVAASMLASKFAIRPPRRTTASLWDELLNLKKVPPHLFDIPFISRVVVGKKGRCFAARFYEMAGGDNYIILLHGHNAAGIQMVRYVEFYTGLGYNCVLPDMSRAGASDGKFVSFGNDESDEVLLWIDKIRELNPNAKIGLMGESMGAATAILAAYKGADVEFVIDYCGYASVKLALKRMFKIFPPAIIMFPGMWIYMRCLGLDFGTVTPLKAAESLTCPVLLLHSKTDKMTYYQDALLIYDNLKNARLKRITLFENAQHGLCHTNYKEDFEKAISDFLAEAEVEN